MLIRTPPTTSDAPRINGPRLYGQRPSRPFQYSIPVSGREPISFATQGLPEGLVLDKHTGRITGVVDAAGDWTATVTATNSLGSDSANLIVRIGGQISLTPPMGWNSWNCYGKSVDQAKVLAQARAMVSTGLSRHGWTCINIDDAWQGRRNGPGGALHPNKKFPDMRGLCKGIHSLGLKPGLYSTPWPQSYAGYPGGAGFAHADARQWADWGVDYLKYDWHPIDLPAAAEMSAALRDCGRDIVYSLSNTASFDLAADYARIANLWRTTEDITDTWDSVSGIGFSQAHWTPYSGPGHWNDPDMLVVGRIGWGDLRPTRLTPDEQYTHITLWCLLSAPLLLGCDLTQLDDFTLGLLSNDEVLAVNQDALGRPAVRIGDEIWTKPLYDGSHAVGLFNRGDSPATITLKLADLQLDGPHPIRDLWRQEPLGCRESISMTIAPHGAELLKIDNSR